MQKATTSTDPAISVPVAALRIGQCIPFGPNQEPSAIQKQPIHHPVALTRSGLTGDQQGDQRHHGGPDKALHHYPEEHYPLWHGDLPHTPDEYWRPGAFGENISTTGLTESEVCIGDIFQLDSTLIQVSQARQPCWKLNLRFNHPHMAAQVQSTGRTGWYYRVLKPGTIAPGSLLTLKDRPHPDWTLARLLHYLYTDQLNIAALTAMAELNILPPSWQTLVTQRLQSGQVENWNRRLTTPAINPVSQSTGVNRK